MTNTRVFLRNMCCWKRAVLTCAAIFAALLAASPVNGQSPKHPLDGLTATEYWTAYEVLQASGKVDDKTRYPLIQLKEPPKEEVLAWKPGQPMRREASECSARR